MHAHVCVCVCLLFEFYHLAFALLFFLSSNPLNHSFNYGCSGPYKKPDRLSKFVIQCFFFVIGDFF